MPRSRMVPICYEKDWDVSAEIERLIVAKIDATNEDAVQRRLATLGAEAVRV